MPTPLEELRQLVDGTRPPPPIATLMGALHGGVLCDIADAAMGIAYASTLAKGETFATIEL